MTLTREGIVDSMILIAYQEKSPRFINKNIEGGRHDSKCNTGMD